MSDEDDYEDDFDDDDFEDDDEAEEPQPPPQPPSAAPAIVLASENDVPLRTAKLDRRNSTRMQGIDLDESKPVAEQLRAALVAKAVRVVDLFREWDDDESGTVTKKEFRQGMKQLGLDYPKQAMDELFDEWDPDKSGELELKELSKQLRRGADITIAKELQAGGAGEIVMKSENKVKLRTAKLDRRNSTRMQGIDLDESKPVAEQLRAALVAKAVRVIDLFREWDDDDSGCVTKKEFRRGMGEMGLDFPAAAMDELFDEWDPDKSGHLELSEITKQLRRGNDITLAKELQAGAAGEIVLKSENEIKLRTAKLDRRNSTRMQGIDLDESKPVAEQLRAALVAKAVRVVDLFREWDGECEWWVRNDGCCFVIAVMNALLPALPSFLSFGSLSNVRLQLRKPQGIHLSP